MEEKLIVTKEEFIEKLKELVLYNIQQDIPFLTDLKQEQVDKVIHDNKLNPELAISWLFDSNLFLIDENHEGWFCPSIRGDFYDKLQRYF